MVSGSSNEYKPDQVSPPGETLLETLVAVGMTQRDLAARTGRTSKHINEIIKGKATVTPEMALQLERVLDVPASFWSSRERHYREALAREHERERLSEYVAWLKQVPVSAMVRLGWVRPSKDKVEQLREVLSFFGVASPEQWRHIRGRAAVVGGALGIVPSFWGFTLLLTAGGLVACRKSRAFQSAPGAVAAWFRKGHIDAQRIRCGPYDARKFRRVLQRVRSATVRPPKVFQPEMVRLCSEVGVAVTFVPELPKTGLSGATYWLTPGKAAIQLSLRYKTDDHLWFTFFHEAGHILLHGKRELFLEGEGRDDAKEEEANKFAANALIPRGEFRRFISAGRPTQKAIRRFARQIGIAPGIVVGRLQHERILDYSEGNRLKRRFTWATE